MSESAELDIKRIVGWIAGSISVTLLIVLPLGFFYSGYQYEVEKGEIHARELVRNIAQFVFLNPDDWMLQESRIASLVEVTLIDQPGHVAFYNTSGEYLYDNASSLPWPQLTVEKSVMDVHTQIGTLYLTFSLGNLVKNTVLVFLFSVVVSIAVFQVLFRLPVRALMLSLSKQERIQKRLQREIASKEHALEEAHRLSRKLHAMAMEDSLTNLPNRAMFHNYLEQALSSAERNESMIAVIMMDLNRFKEVNDTLGHAAGDALLIEVARRAADTLRKSDIIARLGGDEFAMVVSISEPADSENICHNVLEAIRKPFLIEKLQLQINAGGSCGIAVYPQHGKNTETLLQKADIAMYAAKKSAGNIAVFNTSMDQNTPERLRLIHQLHSAMNNNELLLMFQPKVDLKTQRLCGGEALIRWNHPDSGLIPPADFLPWAEESEVIHPLTLWVINKALEVHRHWRDAGILIDLCINISASNLRDRQFDEKVISAIERWDMPADQLILEVTENAMIDNTLEAQKILTRLNDYGIRLAIDDFGTGHASLIQLKNFPFSELKIDRSFVTNMISDSNDAAIVNSATALAKSLHMTTTAEGIEDNDTLALLKLMGCHQAQGFLISPPLENEAFIEWAKSQQEYRLGP